MKIVYVTLNFLPAPLRGSEWLSYQFGKSALQVEDAHVTVITSQVKNYIGFFLPFIGRFDHDCDVIDDMVILRLPHNWFLYTLANCLLVLFLIFRLMPFINRSKMLDQLHAKVAGYAFGVVFKGLEKALRRIDPDIVHVTPIPQIYVTQTIQYVKKINKTKKKQIKLVLTPAMHFNHDVIEKTYPYKDTKKMFDAVDLLVCTTKFERETICKVYGIESKKIVVVNIGVPEKNKNESNGLTLPVKSILLGAKLFKENKGFIILFMGTRCKKKGIYKLLNAIDTMNEEEKKDIRILVGGQETIFWKVFLVLCRLQKKYPFMINLPFLSIVEKQKVFAIADIFAMPSIVDSYGIVYVEAMAASLPVLACKEPPQEEIIQNAGLFNSFENIEELRENILLLKNDLTVREEKGRRARNLFEQNYTEEIMFEKMKKIYFDIYSRNETK